MHGDLSFFEIGVPDADRARAFWGPLLGWRFPPTGEPGQTSVETPSGRGGVHGDDRSARVALYVEVDDVEAAVTRARELGGSADDPLPEEPGFGRFAVVTDDQGVRLGLHQPPG